MKRKIVEINKDKCNGCGVCIPACHEGAIKIIDGVATLLEDKLCDGLGDCLGECPEDAIEIIERDADAFDEEAVKEHLSKNVAKPDDNKSSDNLPCGCPSSSVQDFSSTKESTKEMGSGEEFSNLKHWPVQLKLVPEGAPFFKKEKLLVASDCVPFAMGTFHTSFLNEDTSLVVGCPKLDNPEEYVTKLASIIKQNDIKEINVAVMEVPCCSSMKRIVGKAVELSEKNIEVKDFTIGINGTIKN